MSLKSLTKNRLKLCNYTSIRIGGPAPELFLISSWEDLKEAASRYKFDFYLLGAGSNLLVDDRGVTRPVIKLTGDFDFIGHKGYDVEVGAGTLFTQVINFCRAQALGGLENLAGIPATIGGMLATNASAYQRAISDHLLEVEIFDIKAKRRILKKDEIKFSYRDSSLKGTIILRAKFRLHEDRFIKEKVSDILKERFAKQDYAHPSCGSIFKNPPGFAAGQLIEACRLKGARKNDAQISPKHANFIINLGKAACKDVEYLIHKAKEAVNKKFNIIMEEEVIRWI